MDGIVVARNEFGQRFSNRRLFTKRVGRGSTQHHRQRNSATLTIAIFMAANYASVRAMPLSMQQSATCVGVDLGAGNSGAAVWRTHEGFPSASPWRSIHLPSVFTDPHHREVLPFAVYFVRVSDGLPSVQFNQTHAY
jgi:hypothetical protein